MDKKTIKIGKTACWIRANLAEQLLVTQEAHEGTLLSNMKDSVTVLLVAPEGAGRRPHFLCLDFLQVHQYGKPNHIQNPSYMCI